jgi:hypothetical protein
VSVFQGISTSVAILCEEFPHELGECLVPVPVFQLSQFLSETPRHPSCITSLLLLPPPPQHSLN